MACEDYWMKRRPKLLGSFNALIQIYAFTVGRTTLKCSSAGNTGQYNNYQLLQGVPHNWIEADHTASGIVHREI